jgi:hypothetical protein
MLNRLVCRCEELLLWPKTLLNLVVYFFFLNYLEWTTIQCLITVDRLVENLERTNENGRKGPLFPMFSRMGLCVILKISFSGQWDCWIWWSEFVFFIILSELTACNVIAMYRQGSLHLYRLVHFVISTFKY